jgi:hypothetical protein
MPVPQLFAGKKHFAVNAAASEDCNPVACPLHGKAFDIAAQPTGLTMEATWGWSAF